MPGKNSGQSAGAKYRAVTTLTLFFGNTNLHHAKKKKRKKKGQDNNIFQILQRKKKIHQLTQRLYAVIRFLCCDCS